MADAPKDALFPEDALLKAAEAEAREERLAAFVEESNRIEGIHREPTREEIAAHEELLARPKIAVHHLERFVMKVQPGARLRVRKGQNVTIQKGGKVIFRPQEGGPVIETRLRELLEAIAERRLGPVEAHIAYETLHPFTDGNGRSGRAVWAWQMEEIGEQPFALPFLHRFYYQSLENGRATRAR